MGRLKGFYGRFGFVDSGNDCMVRLPVAKK